MKKILFFAIAFVLIFSCKTTEENVIEEQAEVTVPVSPEPEKKPEPVVQEPVKPEPEPEEVVIATVGDVSITQKQYTETKSEIEIVVEELNTITQKSNYNGWLQYLSSDYKEYLSTPSVLKEVSEKLPIKGVKINNLQDYFKYVFVPSRKNVRVDDIQFTTPTRVNVIMKESGTRLLVYSLEKIGTKWKLVNSK